MQYVIIVYYNYKIGGIIRDMIWKILINGVFSIKSRFYYIKGISVCYRKRLIVNEKNLSNFSWIKGLDHDLSLRNYMRLC